MPAYRKLVAGARRQQLAAQQPGGSAGGAGSAGGGAGPGPADSSSDGEPPPAVAACASWDQVPFWTKEQYIQRYPLPERCMGGSVQAADFIHESSGSSGQPTLWARSCFDELAVCDR